jgi:capsid portal protein
MVENWQGEEGVPMPEARRANEVIHFRIYSPRSPYGIPRYIGELLSVLGERKAGEVNFVTISNNNVPSAAFIVSNGMMTEATVKRIETFSQIMQSDDNRSAFLILEAESDIEGEDAGQVRIDIKPMTDVQMSDALFQVYVKNCRDAIRRSFRIPPVFTGAAEDHSRATVDSSRKLADEQVFGPERSEVDWTINHLILADLGIRFWRFESRTPNVTDNKELIQMLAQGERTGGITPRLSRKVVEDVFKDAADIPPLDPNKFDPDVPFSLTMADRVKNMGGTAGPTEIGQTVAPVQPSADSAVAKAWREHTIRDLLGMSNAAQAEIARAVQLSEGAAE